MTIQSTNIDTIGDAVDLTTGNEVFFTVANGVAIQSQGNDGIVADNTKNFLIYNNGSLVANNFGVELEFSNDHFYNERAGSVFGYTAVEMTTAGQTVVNYGDMSGDLNGVVDTAGDNVISNYGTIEGPATGLNVAGGDFITNEGNISATGPGGVGIDSGAAASLTTIDNTGTIAGAVSVYAIGSGALTLNNEGVLDGGVNLTNTGGDTFTNSGKVYGDVQLGSGTNTFDGRGGIVDGTITGGSGVDTIHLGNDGEIVNGGAGHDKLYGGSGADTFAFTSDGVNWDHIFNFNVNNDTIELAHSTFTKLVRGATPVFAIGTHATTGSDHLFYNSGSAGGLWYDPDGNGSQAPVEIAALGPGLKLTAKDFVVV